MMKSVFLVLAGVLIGLCVSFYLFLQHNDESELANEVVHDSQVLWSFILSEEKSEKDYYCLRLTDAEYRYGTIQKNLEQLKSARYLSLGQKNVASAEEAVNRFSIVLQQKRRFECNEN